MKTIYMETDQEKKELSKKPEIQDPDPGKKAMDEVRTFFNQFPGREAKKSVEEERMEREKLFLEEIRDLDANTGIGPASVYESEEPDLTKENLEWLEENDPGYVNGEVLDYDNEIKSKSNTYEETGIHTGSIRWGEYAAKESLEYITLQPGQLLSRWGKESGSFLSDAGVDYSSLELPVVQEKNEQTIYQVMKPFPVESSMIAIQPWNQKKSGPGLEKGFSDAEKTGVNQYRTPIPVDRLVEGGYLKRLSK